MSDETSNTLAAIDAAVRANRLTAPAADNLSRWLTEPQYKQYVPRLEAMVAAEEFAELDRLFWETIRFGTGGRRGPMSEFGSATINARTIAESAHGLATYLRQSKGTPGGRAAVARDTRNRSPEFARLTATTLAAHGLKVFYFESFRSTPELSFAVRRLHCDVGVVISASHNPPTDNGFKAYWSNGGQVLPPHDQGIIDCVYQAGEIPTVDFDEAVADGRIELIGEAVDRDYRDAVLKLSLSDARDIPALFTPLHGVGETSVYHVLREAGFERVELFGPQSRPDGNFPNVPDHFPNPERPEVFQAAIAYARETGAELILASDPDADRLGVVAKTPGGEYTILSGNRVGALLTDFVLRKRRDVGTLSAEHYVVETLVTTPLIAAIARSYGVRAIDNLLVGFKYIAETMDEQGPDRFVLGAEESLGYLAGDYCRDKDAAIAALYVAEAAAELRQEGRTLLDRLDDLFVAHGYFAEGQRSQVCPGPSGREQIDGLMRAFRTAPPKELAGLTLVSVRDYRQHEVRELPSNTKCSDLPKPSGDVLLFESSPGECRISLAVRPSGTEPKIKFYFFAQSACETADSLANVRSRTDRTLTAVQEALSTWVNGVLEDHSP